MHEITLKLLSPADTALIATIARWYAQEWHIPEEKTQTRFADFEAGKITVHAVLLLNGVPVATGGIFGHVGLMDREPRFGMHPHWLALMFSLPEHRGKGLGTMLGQELLAIARKKELGELYLFTHTAAPLYRRLGWETTEALHAADKVIEVMKIAL